jgi:hypothetical protein
LWDVTFKDRSNVKYTEAITRENDDDSSRLVMQSSYKTCNCM